jgi:hypothetical protein
MIPCPLCGSKTRVLETRVTTTSARRRRGCTVAECSGKVTTVEIVVSGANASALSKGSLLVPARQIARLRELVTAIEGGVL